MLFPQALASKSFWSFLLGGQGVSQPGSLQCVAERRFCCSSATLPGGASTSSPSRAGKVQRTPELTRSLDERKPV